jgi:hypothetical protein
MEGGGVNPLYKHAELSILKKIKKFYQRGLTDRGCRGYPIPLNN